MRNHVSPPSRAHFPPAPFITEQTFQPTIPLVILGCEKMGHIRCADLSRASHRRGHERDAYGHVLDSLKTGFSLRPLSRIQTGVDRIKPDVDRLKIHHLALKVP